MQFAIENNIDFFIEASAKSGINTKEIFLQCTRMLYNDYLLYKELNPNDLTKRTDTPLTKISLPSNEISLIRPLESKNSQCKC